MKGSSEGVKGFQACKGREKHPKGLLPLPGKGGEGNGRNGREAGHGYDLLWAWAFEGGKGKHQIAPDPGDLKGSLQQTPESTLLLQPFSVISEIAMLFPG